MAIKSLAVKYRPQTFNDVTEQGSVITILTQQLETNTTKNAYLFCGGAGTGKTTCARIFANEINHHQGNPIEMDAASNSSVEDVREITQQAKTKSLDSEYKVFIIDECHSLSNTAWQAFLKLIEEPPAKTIFIFCTTDPQKIPKTILSRVQRYDFQRISHKGVVERLDYICAKEATSDGIQHIWDDNAIEYIAKLADGGMRDAITLLDKCFAYSPCLTIDNVIAALGSVDYETMFDLTDYVIARDTKSVLELIETVHRSGKDLKQFIKLYTDFIIDLCKYTIVGGFEYISIPVTYEKRMGDYKDISNEDFCNLLQMLVKLDDDIKWDTAPKSAIQASFLLYVGGLS